MKIQAAQGLERRRVLLVGAGIVNLLTAHRLATEGASVEVLDAGPDPRTRPDRERLGATFGGDDARLFTFTEADVLNESRFPDRGAGTLQRRIVDGGRLAVPFGELSLAERRWIRGFEDLPRHRAEAFAEDVYRFNREGGALWQRLRAESPELFDDVGYTDGVLRIYDHASKLHHARALHDRLGSLRRFLDADALRRAHPAFADAVARGDLAGGLEIEGFALHVHRLAFRLLDRLEKRGVRFRWSRRVHGLERSADGTVAGLRIAPARSESSSQIPRADHYVLSPGAHGGALLEGTRSEGKIQGIAGLWITLPDVEPGLGSAVKIHVRGTVAEDCNLILGRPALGGAGRRTLILGSGYAYVGDRRPELESPDLERLFAAIEGTARRLLPGPYAEAVRRGTLREHRRVCVRPFTQTGLGLFEVLRTTGGGRLVITGGHNTGGFTQAPAVAEAVGQTLAGREHPMQTLYDPERDGSDPSPIAEPAGVSSEALHRLTTT